MTRTGLQMKHVSHSYGSVHAVRDFAMDLAEGELGCLLGSSGCGKTTVFRLIAGLERLQQGEVWLGGEQMAGSSLHWLPQKRRVGVVFQDFALFPHLTVLANVEFGLHQLSSPERAMRAQRVLSDLRVWDLRDRYPHELSGGQKQRVAIARAMAPKPRLLLMDEPFSNLDGRLKEDLLMELGSVFRENKTTVLMITHHIDEAFLFADKMGVMADGHIQQWGAPHHVYQHPQSVAVAQATGRGVALRARIQEGRLITPLGELLGVNGANLSGAELQIFARPEHLAVKVGGEHTVVAVHPMIDASLVEVRLSSGEKLTVHMASHHTASHEGVRPGAKVQVSCIRLPHCFVDGKTIEGRHSSFP